MVSIRRVLKLSHSPQGNLHTENPVHQFANLSLREHLLLERDQSVGTAAKDPQGDQAALQVVETGENPKADSKQRRLFAVQAGRQKPPKAKSKNQS